MKKHIFLLIALAVTVLALSGCFRKSVDSSPPARRPVAQGQTGPSEKSVIISETHTVGEDKPAIIEDTYEVDAAEPMVIDESHDVQPAGDQGPIEVEAVVKETSRPDVGGDDLAEEALPEQEPAMQAAEEQADTAAADAKAEAAFEPATDPEDEQVLDTAGTPEETTDTPLTQMPTATETGSYHVQVGAFSDLENANKVLSRLLSDGYKGSTLEKGDTGMYRVRAGAFADKDAADAALEALRADFPGGFVLKAE